jgi:alkylated DNA repair dioxygenase AlkB
MTTLSPKTCLELIPLMTPQQLDHEILWRDVVLQSPVDFKLRKPSPDSKLVGLYKSLTNSISCEIDELFYDCNSYESLITDFACLVNDAKDCIAELKKSTSSNDDDDIDHDIFYDPPQQMSELDQVPEPDDLPTPVCFLDFSVGEDLDINSVLKGVNLSRVGSRLVAHVGPVDYQYSRTRHPACPYPENPAVERIFGMLRDHLEDPEITTATHSTLFTLYENGKNHLPFHSDNEPSIDPDSDIITVSFGATRDIEFRNRIGHPTRVTHPLKHGSIHVMSRRSQDFWEHRIPPTPSCSGRRVSLTIRKLVEPQPRSIPPIRRPTTAPPPPVADSQEVHRSGSKSKPTPRPKRVLFLSDSINSSFPTASFGPGVECIMVPDMYYLHNLREYEAQFAYTDLVFVSCGINNITRLGDDWDAANMINYIECNLKQWRVKYPNTWFVFNSLLHTKFNWANSEVTKFNNLLFNLTLEPMFENVIFFDSHQVATGLWRQGAHIVDLHHNGVHLTSRAKDCIFRAIHRGLCSLLADSPRVRWDWPLRSDFRARSVAARG